MIHTIRTTVRNLRTGDVIVPVRGDGHGLRGRVTHVHAYGVAVNGVDVRTNDTGTPNQYALPHDTAVSVRRMEHPLMAVSDAMRVANYRTLADRAAHHTLDNKGGTFDPHTLAPWKPRPLADDTSDGYMVGIGSSADGTLRTVSREADRIAEAINQIAPVAPGARDATEIVIG